MAQKLSTGIYLLGEDENYYSMEEMTEVALAISDLLHLNKEEGYITKKFSLKTLNTSGVGDTKSFFVTSTQWRLQKHYGRVVNIYEPPYAMLWLYGSQVGEPLPLGALEIEITHCRACEETQLTVKDSYGGLLSRYALSFLP